MCCIKCVMSYINSICVPLLPYAYIPKRRVYFSDKIKIVNNISYGPNMIR